MKTNDVYIVGSLITILVTILGLVIIWGVTERFDTLNARIDKIGTVICTNITPMPKECEFKLVPVTEPLVWKSEGE